MKPYLQPRQRFTNSVHHGYNEGSKQVSAYDSGLEKDYSLLKRWERVPSYVTQPQKHQLVYLLNGRKTRYTPDAEVVEADGSVNVDEIKPKRKALTADLVDKHEFLAEVYAQQGYAFRLITEDNIYQGDNIENIKMLLPSLKHPAPLGEMRALAEQIPTKPYSLIELQNLAAQHGFEPQMIRRAIAHQIIHVDITLPYREWRVTWLPHELLGARG